MLTFADKTCIFIYLQLKNGFVTDLTREYHFGDQARVQCHRGFRLVGSPMVTCGPGEQFVNLPTCEGNFRIYFLTQ